jgi:hypothetical protein
MDRWWEGGRAADRKDMRDVRKEGRKDGWVNGWSKTSEQQNCHKLLLFSSHTAKLAHRETATTSSIGPSM